MGMTPEMAEKIASGETVKVETLRSHHGDGISVRTKYNPHFRREVEHIEISARTVTLPVITETAATEFNIMDLLK